MRKGKFTAKERAYLLTLPAVESVTQGRIFYTEEFKADCMRRYHEGDSPMRIFAEAGLYSESDRLQTHRTVRLTVAGIRTQGAAGPTSPRSRAPRAGPGLELGRIGYAGGHSRTWGRKRDRGRG